MKTLLAEDSGITRKVILRSLNAVGLDNVIEAADGQEALDAFNREGDVELVVTDWNMPNMNGLELIQSLRGAGSKVPIIMVTTEGEKASVIKALQAGVTDYLIKPFDPETLQQKLERVCKTATA